MLACPLAAQRVQFPTPAQPVQATSPYAAAPNPYAVAPNPYAAPAAAAPPTTFAAPSAPAVSSPYPATPFTPLTTPPAPAYSPAALGPPPAFDPYAVGGTVAPAPPPALPYAPAPTTFGAAPPAPLAPTSPFAAQPAPYDINPSGEAYWAKTQKLLQELSVEYTFLYGKQSDPSDFGLNRIEVSTTLAFPMFGNIETPLLVTPGFAFNWLQGPVSGPPIVGPPLQAGGPDLPPRVYDAYLDFAWFPHCNEWLGAELGLRPGVYTDFDNVDSDSLRIMGRGAGTIAIMPNTELVLGAVYLDRVDTKILPVIGVHCRPDPDWDIYAVFPNPKIRKFLASVGTTKWYGYAAGEYGGGSWTVARQTTDDYVGYNDIRVIGGFEYETQSQIRGHIEMGFVFDREIVFVSQDPPNFKPDDTFMIRAGVDF